MVLGVFCGLAMLALLIYALVVHPRGEDDDG